MRNRRLQHRFTSVSYARNRWPHSRAMLPSQTSAEIRQLSIYECCLMAGLSAPALTRHHTGISHNAIKKVAKVQSRLMRLNAYHNQAHICQVIIAAGLLADEASISQVERDILIVAALIHDFGHRGAKRNKTPFWQEVFSCDKALPLLISGGMDSRLVGLFYEMVLATSPLADADTAKAQGKGQNKQQGDDIISLLADADLYASLFGAKRDVDKLTGQLKFEERLTMPMADLRDGFLASCKVKGLSSLAGQALHDRLGTNMTYFRSR